MTYIGVIGSGENVSQSVLDAAKRIGMLIAENDAVLVCGGRGGVMEAACEGAKSAGGITIGILPGLDRSDVNPFVDISIPTGLGFALRNFITVRSCDALIMLHGEIGTLSEVVIAYQHGIPVVVLEPTGGWAGHLRKTAYEEGAYLDGRKLMQITYADTPEEAVEIAYKVAGSRKLPAKIWRVGC